MNKLCAFVFILLVIGGCATTTPDNTKATLLGKKGTTMVPVTGAVERVFFISADGQEKKTFWGSYPETMKLWPGSHEVLVSCEWRPNATAPPMAKGQQKFNADFEAGKIYKFTSSLEDSGNCSISYEILTEVITK